MSLLLQIIILLIAILIVVPLVKRYAKVTILGYLITGIVLGVSGLHLVTDIQLIKSLTNVSMIILMLLIGLNFRPQQLWLERHTIFNHAGLPLASSAVILVVVCFLLLQHILTSIILGIALAFSSFFLVQQLLHNQLNTQLGQSTIANLQFQALITLVLIALFPLLEDTASTRHGIAYFAAIIATVSGLFLTSRYLIQPAFRFLGRHHSLELIAILSLLVILSVMFIMDILNIHILIGAFLAGMLLADTELKTEVERIIHPFRNAAIGMLFLAIGLSLSLTPLLQAPVLLIGSILTLVIIKATVIAAFSFYQQRQLSLSLLSALTLAQSGEFTFILIKIAATEQLLNQEIVDLILLMICGSILFTPLLYGLYSSKLIPILQKKISYDQEHDIPQHPILIIGFGRFGQVIARVLHAQGKSFSVIDSNQPDADFIEQYGYHFFNADVTQVANLRAAGIEYCKLLILVIDDVEDSMNIARHLRLNYPDLTIFARARDRHHAQLLSDMGIQYVWRETYLSSLNMAQHALIQTGLCIQDAQTQIEQFQQQDHALLKQQYRMDDHHIVEPSNNTLSELKYLFEKIKYFPPTVENGMQSQQTDANSRHESS